MALAQATKSKPAAGGNPSSTEAVTLTATQYWLPVLFLCADLVRSVEKRREFDKDPYVVMDDYDLDPTAQEAMYTMHSAPPASTNESWEALWNYIWEHEVKNFVVDVLYPLPADPECVPRVFYPNPKLSLYKVSPETAPAGSTDKSITVKGMGMWKKTELLLRDTVNNKDYVVLKNGKPTGTYRCSHLTGKLDLSDVTTPGNYKFVARNAKNTGTYVREYEHPTPFVVT
jgi:hypothetical protein